MYGFKFYLLVAVLYSCSGFGYGSEGITTQKPVTIDLTQASIPSSAPPVVPVETETSSTAAPTDKPTSSTAKATPPPEPTPSSTAKPTPPPEPTPSPSPAPTPSPTPSPTPTPTPAPTPKPTPGPVPAPTQHKWSYNDKKNNRTCIILEFAAQLNVSYPVVSKESPPANLMASVIFNVPENASVVNGSCNATDQWLTISWVSDGINASLPNNLTFIYHMNQTTKDYALKSVNITLTPELFVNTFHGVVSLSHSGAEWQTPLQTSYRCNPATRMNLTEETNSIVAGLTLSRLQEEAYRNGSGEQFSAARECGGGDIPDAVPIAVGCALGGLVVVVLIAYLVGRRRSAARGYLSM